MKISRLNYKNILRGTEAINYTVAPPCKLYRSVKNVLHKSGDGYAFHKNILFEKVHESGLWAKHNILKQLHEYFYCIYFTFAIQHCLLHKINTEW